MAHNHIDFPASGSKNAVYIEDSTHAPRQKVFLAVPDISVHLTADEARAIGMELIYRAGSMYKPGEEE